MMPLPPPNILWYCTDQQRFDTIGALGNPHIRTPNLDGLVREGVTFTHTYCQCTVCLPSRASFMTGRYPGTIHANHNAADHFPRGAETTLVTRLLAAGGYDCGLVGKLHLAGAFRFDSEFGLAARLIDDGEVDLAPLITGSFSIAEAESAFAAAMDRNRSMKVQIDFAVS